MVVKKKNNKDESSMRGFLPGILVGVLLSIGYNYIFEAPPEIASAKIEEIVNSPEVKKVKYDFYQLLKENEILISDDELSGPEKSDTGSYLLQVGSFKSINDAENRKVELLLLNLPTKVEKITVKSERKLRSVNETKVIVALDYSDQISVDRFCDQVSPNDCKLKVGKELFALLGPKLVTELMARGFDIFLDLKFHDIPNTVARAIKVVCDLGVWMTNVHCLGGQKMMMAANEARVGIGSDTNLIGVTMLTSHDASDLQELGITQSMENQVLSLASQAKNSGLDGVVCSARECKILRNRLGGDFQFVTPGIRLDNDLQDDQTRVLTPMDAIKNGSNYLVIGRPITRSDNPAGKLRLINESIQLNSSDHIKTPESS